METLVRPRTVVGRKEVDFRDDERKSKGGQREKKNSQWNTDTTVHILINC